MNPFDDITMAKYQQIILSVNFGQRPKELFQQICTPLPFVGFIYKQEKALTILR